MGSHAGIARLAGLCLRNINLKFCYVEDADVGFVCVCLCAWLDVWLQLGVVMQPRESSTLATHARFDRAKMQETTT